MVLAIFCLGVAAAILALWKVMDCIHSHPFREIRVTGVDYWHSQGTRLWDNYDPKKDWVFVVKHDEVLHQINPENIAGVDNKTIQYRSNEGEVEAILVESFLGPPSNIRTCNKIIINKF